MTLRELHEAAVRKARPCSSGENEWFIWWYRAQLRKHTTIPTPDAETGE